MESSRRNYIRLWGVCALLALIPAGRSSAVQQYSEQSFPTIQMMEIRPGVMLEVVNWGGDGQPMVFLAGLGHTAHVFDEFAPRFTAEYRVVGITRRGFGISSQPPGGYSLDTLVDDLRLVLNSLELKNVILVGHSLGGDEIAAFARIHPEKVSAVIFLEGAFDRTATADSLKNYPIPEMNSPEPIPAELQSPEAYRQFYERTNGVRMPLTEIVALYNWHDDGSRGDGVTPGWIYGRIIQSLRDPVYAGITQPALAIYGVEYPIEELFMEFAQADTADQRLMLARYEATKRLGCLSRERFHEQMAAGVVIAIQGAGHSLYITHADRVEREMRAFMSGLKHPLSKPE